MIPFEVLDFDDEQGLSDEIHLRELREIHQDDFEVLKIYSLSFDERDDEGVLKMSSSILRIYSDLWDDDEIHFDHLEKNNHEHNILGQQSHKLSILKKSMRYLFLISFLVAKYKSLEYMDKKQNSRFQQERSREQNFA